MPKGVPAQVSSSEPKKRRASGTGGTDPVILRARYIIEMRAIGHREMELSGS